MQIVADLRRIVPGEGVIDAEEERRAYECDALSAYRQLPMVVVLPSTTAQVAADMWRFSKLNAALANPKLATENDAEEYGKGHEFPTATFKTAWDVGATLEKYLSAEIGACLATSQPSPVCPMP